MTAMPGVHAVLAIDWSAWFQSLESSLAALITSIAALIASIAAWRKASKKNGKD